MKLKDGFITHETGGEQIMVSTGGTGFTGLVRSNKTAGLIVEMLKTDTTRDAIVAALLEKFDAPEAVIAGDVDMVLSKLRSIDALAD